MTLAEALLEIVSWQGQVRQLSWPEWDRLVSRWYGRWVSEALAPPPAAGSCRERWLTRARMMRKAAAVAVAVRADTLKAQERAVRWRDRALDLPGEMPAQELVDALLRDLELWEKIEARVANRQNLLARRAG